MFKSSVIGQKVRKAVRKLKPKKRKEFKSLDANEIYRRDTSESLNQLKNLEGRFCPNPFTQLDIYEYGDSLLLFRLGHNPAWKCKATIR